MPYEKEKFLVDFKLIVDDVVDDFSALPMTETVKKEVTDHVKNVLEYNVPGGKLTRGLSTVDIAQALSDLDSLTFRRATTLGWCVEILQALFLVADDVMDSSITRRGKPCWYRLEHIGVPNAVNDGLLLNTVLLRLLERHFCDTDLYAPLLNILLTATHRTVCGQYLDTNTQPIEGVHGIDLSRYTMDRYRAIVEYKTAYYTFYLPAAFGMTVAGIKDKKLFQEVEALCIALGVLFQTQDDVLDCYAKPEILGKIGTDIEEKKCTWLCCQFLLMCTPAERKEFQDNYGVKDPEKVARVKALYAKYEMEKVFEEYEASAYKEITEQIRNLSHPGLCTAFANLLSVTYKRQK